MSIDVESHFSIDMNVTAKVYMKTPNGTEIIFYENPSVLIPASGYWYDDAFFYFSEDGLGDNTVILA